MTKKKFLSLLEEKISFLNEKEKKSIIDNYVKKIEEEKLKGKKEKDIILEFGEIDDIVNEVLEKYKHKNTIKEAAQDTKDIMDKFDKTVSECAKFFSDGLKKIYSNFVKKNGKINLEIILEILIKIIVLLGLFAIIKLPFNLFIEIGYNVSNNLLEPINQIIGFLWHMLLIFTYLLICIFISISFFKKYFFDDDKQIQNEYSKFLKSFIRVVVTVLILVPIWCINLGIVLATVFFIYLLIKGVSVLSVILILIGLSLLFGFIADIIESLIYGRHRTNLLPFLISSGLIMIGSLIFTQDSLEFTYVKNINTVFETKEITNQYFITDKIEITGENLNKKLLVDDTLENGEIVIKINYYDILDIELSKNNDEIDIDISEISSSKKLINVIVEHLKDKKIYNYSDLFEIDVWISANENTLKLIEL